MFFESIKTFIADNMLNLAGILGGNIFSDTQTHKKLCKHLVALKGFFGSFKAHRGQSQMAVLVHLDVSAVFKNADSTADTGF